MTTLSVENENEISLLSHTRFYWHSNWQLNFGNSNSNNDAINGNGQQATTSNNSNLQPPNHRQRPTTTILSALKRCNYFMPDNNLILSMLQNVQAANKCDSCGIRGVFCRVQTVWVRLMVAKCKLVAVAVFSFLYPYANQGEPVAFCCSKLIGF